MPLQQTVKETGPHDPNTIVTIITLWHMASLLIQWLTKCQKTMDMWLDWIRCCQAQQQFNFQLKRDQQTSPIKHHEKIWSTYVLDLTTPSSSHPCVLQLQGCIRIICQDTYKFYLWNQLPCVTSLTGWEYITGLQLQSIHSVHTDARSKSNSQ